MQQYPLNILFKGERDYLHGSDLYIATQKIIENTIGKESWVNHIVFRGFARNACELILGEINDVDIKTVRAKCTVRHKEESIQGTIIETGRPVTGSYAFDENKVAETTVLEGQSVRQVKRAGFSSIEELIVLTKVLHNQLIPLQAGRWIFSQLDLTEPFSNDLESCYTVILQQNLASRMTVSKILQHDKEIGKIRFTVTQ